MVIMEDSGTCNSPLISLTALLEVPVVHLVCDNINLYAILYFFTLGLIYWICYRANLSEQIILLINKSATF